MSESGRVPYPDLIILDPDEPMKDTHWYKWLKEDSAKTDVFHEAFIMYLPGFDITKHTIPQIQLDRYRHIFQHFHWLKYHCSERI